MANSEEANLRPKRAKDGQRQRDATSSLVGGFFEVTRDRIVAKTITYWWSRGEAGYLPSTPNDIRYLSSLGHIDVYRGCDQIPRSGTIPDRSGDVIRRRFGFESEGGQEETLEQIGVDYGVTRERIRQIEAKALERLRHPGRVKRLSLDN